MKLEQLLMQLLNPLYECETSYLHKCFLLPPEILAKAGIELTKVIQYPGEIVFTLYGAYYWVFNAGFNVCEASNLKPMYKEMYKSNCSKSCFINDEMKTFVTEDTTIQEMVEYKGYGSTKKERRIAVVCEKCNVSFSRASVKRNHDKTYHGEYLTMYSCEVCGLESLTAKNISTHHESSHEDIPMPKVIFSKQVKNTQACKQLLVIIVEVWVFLLF